MKATDFIEKFKNKLTVQLQGRVAGKGSVKIADQDARNGIDKCVTALQDSVSGNEIQPSDLNEIIKKFDKIIDSLQKKESIRGIVISDAKQILSNFDFNPSFQNAPAGKTNTDLARVRLETKKIAERDARGLDADITNDMIKHTVCYRSDPENRDLEDVFTKKKYSNPAALAAGTPYNQPANNATQTGFEVINQDTFVTAKQLIDQGLQPLVLNMANKISIGGGWEDDTTAQEETLFRCSNYFRALYPLGAEQKNGKHQGRYYYHTQIPEFGSYYTPKVQVFRDASNNYQFVNPFAVDCIAVAGYDLGKPHLPHLMEKNLCDANGKALNGQPLKDAFKKFTKEKIRHILDVAIHTGHDSLVLGALSCGAFKLRNDNTGETATLVAEAYVEVFQEPAYANRFKKVSFAVMSNNAPNSNFDVFQNHIKQLNQANQVMATNTTTTTTTTTTTNSTNPVPLAFSTIPFQTQPISQRLAVAMQNGQFQDLTAAFNAKQCSPEDLLWIAIKGGHADIVQHLIAGDFINRQYMDVNQIRNNLTPLDMAVRNELWATAKALLECGGIKRLATTTEDLLFMAVQNKDNKIVTRLLNGELIERQFMNIHAKRNGENPLDVALRLGANDIADTLRQYGAQPSSALSSKKK